jgi:signal peptidase II
MPLTTMSETVTTDNLPPATSNSVATRDRRPILFLISALVIALDRLTKLWIVHRIRPGYSIPVIPGVFRLSHVLNTGAAFSMMENWRADYVRIGLVSFSAIAAILVFILLWRVGRALTLTSVALALILGGALGNLYDRVVLHHVVDFLAVNIYHYHWPDFNVADSCIVIGACLLLLEIFQPQKEEMQQ